jgi:hypothetical protein
MAPVMALRVMDFAIMALRAMNSVTIDSVTMAFRITAIVITSMPIVLAPGLKSLSAHR